MLRGFLLVWMAFSGFHWVSISYGWVWIGLDACHVGFINFHGFG